MIFYPQDCIMHANDLDNLTGSFYKQLLESMDEGVYFVDRDRRIVFWNNGAQNISGYTSEEVQNRFCGDGILEHIDFDGNLLCGEGCPLKATIRDGEEHHMDVLLRHRDGYRVPVRVIASPVRNAAGEIIGAVERFFDITPQIADRSRIHQLAKEANTDALTGIPNRRYLQLAIHSQMHRFTTIGAKFGVMFIDLNDLKEINDANGHNAGDCAIKVVARTLQSTFRREDIVGRWGGDEFLVVMEFVDLAQLEKIKEKVKKIVGGTRLPEECGGGNVSVSIGIAEAVEGDTTESLVQRADVSMYADKRLNKREE